MEIQVPFLQAIFDTSFRLLQWFFGFKMELICAILVNAILKRNLPES